MSTPHFSYCHPRQFISIFRLLCYHPFDKRRMHLQCKQLTHRCSALEQQFEEPQQSMLLPCQHVLVTFHPSVDKELIFKCIFMYMAGNLLLEKNSRDWITIFNIYSTDIFSIVTLHQILPIYTSFSCSRATCLDLNIEQTKYSYQLI